MPKRNGHMNKQPFKAWKRDWEKEGVKVTKRGTKILVGVEENVAKTYHNGKKSEAYMKKDLEELRKTKN